MSYDCVVSLCKSGDRRRPRSRTKSGSNFIVTGHRRHAEEETRQGCKIKLRDGEEKILIKLAWLLRLEGRASPRICTASHLVGIVEPGFLRLIVLATHCRTTPQISTGKCSRARVLSSPSFRRRLDSSCSFYYFFRHCGGHAMFFVFVRVTQPSS